MTHVLAYVRSAFYRTSDISQSSITINQQKFFDEPRVPGFSAHSTAAVHHVQ